MIAFIARFIGLWMIAGALVALVIDGTKTIAASTLTVTPLGQSWYSISPSTLMSAQNFVQGTDRNLYRALAVGSAHRRGSCSCRPGWCSGSLGTWLVYVGRKRRMTAAYAS